MKVTRQKLGYKIRCSDSEFAALRRLVMLGTPLVFRSEAGKPMDAGLTPWTKRVLRSGRFRSGALDKVDHDCRAVDARAVVKRD